MRSEKERLSLRSIGGEGLAPPNEASLSDVKSHLDWLAAALPGFSFRRSLDDGQPPLVLTSGVERLTGYRAVDFLQTEHRTLDSLIHEEDRERVLEERRASILKLAPYEIEYRLVHRDQSVRRVRELGRPFCSDGRVEFLDGYVDDQADLRQMRVRDERRSEDFRRQQAALVSLVTSDAVASGDFEEASRLATELLSEAVGVARASTWLLRENHTSLELVTLFECAKKGHKDGVSLRAEQYPSYFDALNTGRLIDAHDARRDPRTSEFKDEYLVPLGITSMLDVAVRVSGRVQGVVCLEHIGPRRTWSDHEIQFAGEVADQLAHALLNHERKLAQERESELHEQLFFSQKMEAVGQLAGSVAHDFNNLLTIISGFAEELHDSIADPASRADVEEIIKAAKQGTELTTQLLSMSRREPLELKGVNIANAVRELSQVLPKMLAEDVTLSVQAPEAKVVVKSSLGLIQQILTNLVVNAGHAMNHRGTVLLKVEAVEHDSPFDVVQGMLPPGRYGLLQVTDSGRGMDKDVLARIFEPFFTTRIGGTGTGLGLSTVYNIVARCSGGIRVSSAVGVGTTFSVFLPLDETGREEPRPSVAPADECRWAEGLEIVVVEDNAAVLGVMQNSLSRVGARVTTANRPDEAIEILETWNRGNENSPDLVLTDMGMPGGGGTKVIRWLQDNRPNVPIGIVSGYIPDNQLASTEGIELLRKPFLSADLQEFAREIFEASRLDS